MGVSLAVDDGALVVTSPAGEVPRALGEALAAHRSELLELLGAEAEAWSAAQAFVMVRVTESIAQQRSADGLPWPVLRTFNTAVAMAHRCRSLQAVQAACDAFLMLVAEARHA